MIIAGVDEAGKGPVIGSLVLCGVTIEEKNIKKLIKLGVKDSKLTTRKQREAVYDNILKLVNHKVIFITPEEIDNAMVSPSSNLVKIEAKKTVELLKYLKPDKAFIDCPERNPENYRKYLKEIKAELIIEHKAEQYPVVAAASIIAKVNRDRHVDELKKEYDIDFGSGYCHDPKTQAFIKEHVNNEKFSSIIRKQWATVTNEIVRKEQKSLSQF